MSKKKLWHRISDAAHRKLLDSGATWGKVMELYQQPSWCGYPDALQGIFGCWSLVFRKHTIHRRRDCKKCEFLCDSTNVRITPQALARRNAVLYMDKLRKEKPK